MIYFPNHMNICIWRIKLKFLIYINCIAIFYWKFKGEKGGFALLIKNNGANEKWIFTTIRLSV